MDGRYQHPIAVYADRYGASPRTVKRWKALGAEREDPVPLDDPERMREWWAKNMSQRCPDKLLAAAVTYRREVGLPDPPPAPLKSSKGEPLMELPVQKVEKPLPVRRELVAVEESEIGIEATYRRLQEAEVQAHRIYLEALQSGDDGKAKLAQKAFTDAATKVADLEKKVLAHRLQIGDLIPRLEAEKVLADFHQDFNVRWRAQRDEVFRVFGIAKTPENERKWDEQVDLLCTHLQTEVFEPATAA